MASIGSQVAHEGLRLAKMALLAAAGLALIAAGSLFSADPFATFFRILGLLGTALLLVSVALMVVTFRKARAVAPGALVVSLVVAAAALLVQLAVAQARPSAGLALAALFAGLLIGAAWSMTTLFFIDGDAVRSRGTAWYLVVWAGTLALNQLTAALAGGAPAATVAILLVGSGIVAGNICGQLLRYRSARKISEGRSAGLAPAGAVR